MKYTETLFLAGQMHKVAFANMWQHEKDQDNKALHALQQLPQQAGQAIEGAGRYVAGIPGQVVNGAKDMWRHETDKDQSALKMLQRLPGRAVDEAKDMWRHETDKDTSLLNNIRQAPQHARSALHNMLAQLQSLRKHANIDAYGNLDHIAEIGDEIMRENSSQWAKDNVPGIAGDLKQHAFQEIAADRGLQRGIEPGAKLNLGLFSKLLRQNPGATGELKNQLRRAATHVRY